MTNTMVDMNAGGATIEISDPSELQVLTCFPNDNSKEIDYVIYYQYGLGDQTKEEFLQKEKIREQYLARLKEESLETYKLSYNDDNDMKVFILIHCPIDRLLAEAERVKLDMKINNV